MNSKPHAAAKFAQLRDGVLSGRQSIFLCLAWIGSAILIGTLLWFFTQNYRIRLLTETVNRTLARNGGRERIETPPLFTGGPAYVMGGYWFKTTGSSDKAFIFSIMRGGAAAACAAITDSNGKVKTILPIGENAEQVLEELPLPVYRFYAARIEQDAHRRMGIKNR
ncbi:MAG: hypothetical protein LBB72_03025 [Spirochaetaceae bacterium]|nr:hypothetical protein [Spirochaetaceae bacterium]